ncbi:MAG: hypothetical protein JWN04_6595 [Myxococcaceae bacterium]|nr:hypothetical protein [Myxococcaceae bacterium]
MSDPTRLSDDRSSPDTLLRAAIRLEREDVPTSEVLDALVASTLVAVQAAESQPQASLQRSKPRTRAYTFSLIVSGALIGVLLLLLRAGHTGERHFAPRGQPQRDHLYSTSPAAPRTQDPAPRAPDSTRVGATTDLAAQPSSGVKRARAARSRVVETRQQPLPADEVLLLQRAKKLVLAAPVRALSLAREHERDYPHGAFREEREAIIVEALWRLNKQAEAAARFSDFRARYPTSAYRERLEAWLGTPQHP